MSDVKRFKLNASLLALLGFGKKSRQLIGGFEGVSRAIMRNKLEVIVLDAQSGKHTFEKIVYLARKQNIPVWVANSQENEPGLEKHTGYKVLGIVRGGLASGFLSKLKQEN